MMIMTMKGRLVLLALVLVQLRLVQSFAVLGSMSHHTSKLQRDMLPNHDSNNSPTEEDPANDNVFRCHVIVSDALILPGEFMTVFLSEEEALPLLGDSMLKYGSVDHENGGNMGSVVAAVRLMSEEDPSTSIAHIASFCEITGIHAGKQPGEYIQVDFQCMGQVRLHEMTRQYSRNHFQFVGEYIDPKDEDDCDFEKARALETSIELLMKQVSHMEQEIELEESQKYHQQEADMEHYPHHPPSLFARYVLYDRYEAAKANIEKLLASAFQGQQEATEDMLRLTATSWGVFMCLNDPSLESRYRLRAMDWDNLLERIELAQYALREKQLRLQGRLMEMRTGEEPIMTQEEELIDKYALDEPDAFQ